MDLNPVRGRGLSSLDGDAPSPVMLACLGSGGGYRLARLLSCPVQDPVVCTMSEPPKRYRAGTRESETGWAVAFSRVAYPSPGTTGGLPPGVSASTPVEVAL